MTKEETKNIIKVMRAYADGNKIEIVTTLGNYIPTNNPSWDWGDNPNRYRVVPNRLSIENKVIDLCKQTGMLVLTNYYDMYRFRDLNDTKFLNTLKDAFKEVDFSKAPTMHKFREVVDFICTQCNIK